MISVCITNKPICWYHVYYAVTLSRSLSREEEECVETSQVSDEAALEKEEGQGELRRRRVDKEATHE